MDLSEFSFERLVGMAYDALETPQQWRRLYEELAAAVGAKSVHMLGIDKRHGTLSYSDGANMPVQGELAYMQKYRFVDPRLEIILRMPVHDWLHCHEVLDEQFVAGSLFYQEFLIPYDRRYLSGCKLVDSSDATVILAVMRGAAEGPLAADAVAFLDRLLPHLARACRLGVKNFIYSTQALVGHTLVSKLRQPVILMSSGGEVVHANDSALRLMRETSLVRVENGMLWLPSTQRAELLSRCMALEQALKSADPALPGAARFHTLDVLNRTRPDGSRDDTLYTFFSMLAPQDVMGSFGLRPIVMLFFYHPMSVQTIDSDLLYAAFGLTPAECRVAALLAEGYAPKEIAHQLGTRHDTVRKQLRAIYQKTSTNRQPDLIRLLLNLPHNAVG